MFLTLASASPRRAALLEAAGIPFHVDPVDVDESPHPGERAEDYVVRLAVAKGREGAVRHPSGAVLGADTTVVVDDRFLGKPDDPGHAAEMLRALSGRSHEVLTGVAVFWRGREASALERTRVHVHRLSDAEISWYVGTGEPVGKAGAYAIQGGASRFIDRIEGSYTNVVGLPVSLVYRLLRDLGWFDALGESPGGRPPPRPGPLQSR